MPLSTMRVKHFRAFGDSGEVAVSPLFGLVGKNDAGKSTLLKALDVFFNPPKRGGIPGHEFHLGDTTQDVVIELSFDPMALADRTLRIDARNVIDVVDDFLVDESGMLRIRLTLSKSGIEGFELRIQDVDDVDLYPLAMKKQDELLELLAARGLPAVPAGQQTNKEKRDDLRAAASAQGCATKADWVDAIAIEKAVRTLLPEFLYFTDDSNYAIGQTAVQNQFKGVVDSALAALPATATVEAEVASSLQSEFDEVAVRLNRLTSDQITLTADPKVSWKKAVDSVGLQWQDGSGMATPYEQRGAGMRRLFMVAYFQYQAARSLHDPSGPKFLFAVEEPEVHLHPGAQRELVTALRDLADAGHSVVFTTHSPTFVSELPFSDVALVTRAGSASSVDQSPDPVDLAAELGVEASDRLVGRNYVVLVEGPGDVEYYSHLLSELYAAGDTALDPSKVLFLGCGGIGSLKYWVNAQCMDQAGLAWAVVTDSDRAAAGDPPDKSVQAVVTALGSSSCAHVHVLERSFIENYLDDSSVLAVTGLSCTIPSYGKGLDPTGAPLSKGQWNKVKDNVVPISQHMGLANVKACAGTPAGTCEWVDMFEAIRVGFGL